MRFMGWSYRDLVECPYDYLPVIADEYERVNQPR